MLRVGALTLMLLTGAWHEAAAGDGGPVCRRDTVVDEMQRQIRIMDHDARIVRRLVQQTPMPAFDIVRCDVCALDAIYDTPRLGDNAARRCVAHVFEVRTVTRGFIVRPIARP